MNTNIQQALRKRASLINHPPQPYVGDLPTRPLTSEPLPQRQHVSNKSHIVRTSDDTVFKEKVSDAFSSLQSRKTVSFLFRIVILLALLITIFLIKNQTQYQGHAAGLGKNLYGIASGSNLTGFSSTNLNTYLNDYKTVGAQWIRNDFSWAGIQPNSPTSYNWTPYDTVVSAVNAHGLKVLGVLL